MHDNYTHAINTHWERHWQRLSVNKLVKQCKRAGFVRTAKRFPLACQRHAVRCNVCARQQCILQQVRHGAHQRILCA